jgi:peptide/nickel transport system permease protein
MKFLLRNLSSVLLLFILAALPLAFFTKGNQVTFEVNVMVKTITDFLKGLIQGDSWYYSQGDRTRNIVSDLVSYFTSSYLYLTVSAIIVLIISIILGIFLWKKSDRWINASLGFIGMIPDFMLVLIIQLTVVYLNKSTGVRMVKIASTSIYEPAIVLPIFTLTIIPVFYLVRSLSEITSDVSAEDYILTAKSKGLGKIHIYIYHVTSNVLPFLKADLHKVLGIMIGNLFIIEYLYNTRGITALMFQLQIMAGYQFNLTVICIFSLVILYFACYYTLKLFLAALERCIFK